MMVMVTYWADFDQCINDRVAYYWQQYEQATAIYSQLSRAARCPEEDLIDILCFQQEMVDELSRLQGLARKYTLPHQAALPNNFINSIESVRFN